MAGPRRRVERVVDSIFAAVNWLSSSLASDDDVQCQVDNAAGESHEEAEPAEIWTIAGVQSRPKAGNETDGFAKALRVQLGDTLLVIGTHDPRHVETCNEGELVLHALGRDGSRRAKIVIKPDGTIDVSGTEVVIGNPDGTLQPIPLGTAIKNHFDAQKTYLDGHQHAYVGAGTGSSPQLSSPPTLNSAGTPVNASPTVPTVESSKHSVET